MSQINLIYVKRTQIEYSETRDISRDQIISLYKQNEWSSAEKPDKLHKALLNSHSLVSAWKNDQLVGVGNAISDGYLVVYYPHLLVLPPFQRQGIGKNTFKLLMKKYEGFHQHMLVADHDATGFYKSCGFSRAGKTIPMWIYTGKDH